MKEKLFHPKLQLLVRIVLGGILVYASWHKIADPPDFAKIIYNYRLFPESSIHMLAVFVPWICLLYTSPSPRDLSTSRMPSSA